MSRSCHSGTFSSAACTWERTTRPGRRCSRTRPGSACAAWPRSPSAPCRTAPPPRARPSAEGGGSRWRCGPAKRPGCPARTATPRSGPGARPGWRLGSGREAEPLHHRGLDLGSQVGVGADRAGDLAEARSPPGRRRGASRFLPASAYQAANFRPRVYGSAWMPWVRPTITVSRCSLGLPLEHLHQLRSGSEQQVAGLRTCAAPGRCPPRPTRSGRSGCAATPGRPSRPRWSGRRSRHAPPSPSISSILSRSKAAFSRMIAILPREPDPPGQAPRRRPVRPRASSETGLVSPTGSHLLAACIVRSSTSLLFSNPKANRVTGLLPVGDAHRPSVPRPSAVQRRSLTRPDASSGRVVLLGQVRQTRPPAVLVRRHGAPARPPRRWTGGPGGRRHAASAARGTARSAASPRRGSSRSARLAAAQPLGAPGWWRGPGRWPCRPRTPHPSRMNPTGSAASWGTGNGSTLTPSRSMFRLVGQRHPLREMHRGDRSIASSVSAQAATGTPCSLENRSAPRT